MSTSVNKKPCVHEDCDGSVRTPMVVCPSCGFETDAKIRQWIKEESKKPRKPPKMRNQGFGIPKPNDS